MTDSEMAPTEGAIVPVSEVRNVAPESAIVAVGDAKTSSTYIPDIEGLKKVLTHTRAVGVVLPPPDIRAIIDKTAQFVSKNGAWRAGAVCVACAWRRRMRSCTQRRRSHRLYVPSHMLLEASVSCPAHRVRRRDDDGASLHAQATSSRSAFWRTRRTTSSSTSSWLMIPTTLTTRCG